MAVLSGGGRAAIEWLRNATEQGSPKAQDLLGIANDQGVGIEQGYEEALRFSPELIFCDGYNLPLIAA